MTELDLPRTLPAGFARSTSELYLGIASAGMAWISTAYRVGPASQWESDYRLVQIASGQAIGWDGIISAALSRMWLHLPLGTLETRAALTSAIATALVSWLVFRICADSLRAAGQSGPTLAFLSFGTAMLWSVAPSTALVAARPSGSMLAVAGLLGVILVAGFCNNENPDILVSPRRVFFLGVLVAITFLEQYWVGVLTVLALVALYIRARCSWNRSTSLSVLLGLSTTWLGIGVPWLATRRTVLSQSLASGRPDPTAWPQWRPPSLETLEGLLRDQGVLPLLLALLGLATLMGRRKYGPWLLLVALAAPEFCLKFKGDGAPTTRLLALAALFVGSTFGLLWLIETLGRRRKSPTALTTSLAVVSQLVACLAHADETHYLVDGYRDNSTEVFTDELVGMTRLRSVLLLDNPLLIRRILASQIAFGLRPDLLVVPLEVATQQSVVAELLHQEPALMATLRELTISDRPSPFALSTLADERPVYTELDPTWDIRLREHLLPLPFLHRLHPQALGRSDRSSVLELSLEPLAHIEAAIASSRRSPSDPVVSRSEQTTLELVEERLAEQLTILLYLGDRQTFDALYPTYERMFPGSRWARSLRERLASPHRAIDAFDLLTVPAQTRP